MNRLTNTFLDTKLDAVIHPVPNDVQNLVKQEQVAVDEALKRKQQPAGELVKLVEKKADKGSTQVFISYSRHDVDFAEKVNNDLNHSKIHTWIDSIGIRSGDDWPERIATAILESKIVLAIVSPDSLVSKWVNRELSFADKNEILVFPLIYKTCKIPHWFDLRFGNIQWADFTFGTYDENMSTLLVSIKKSLDK